MPENGHNAFYDDAFDKALYRGKTILVERFGENRASETIRAMRDTYRMIRPHIPDLKIRTARWLLSYCVICFPLYKTIKGDYPQEEALDVVYDFIITVLERDLEENLPWMAKRMMKSRLLCRILFRAIWGKMTKLNDPNGWVYEFLPTEKAHLIDVNIHRCGIHKFLSAHRTPELTQLLCRCDYYMVEHFLPKGVKLIRTQTIAEGAKYCDFRYHLQK